MGVKISNLPSATVPLTGAELVPVVQGGVTSKAQVFDLLSGDNGSGSVGFLQSGTGATARTVEGKLRDVVSVKDFGAVGDGVTDDTAAIQAAFDYANSLLRDGISSTTKHPGATVVIPSGSYSLASIASTINVKCNVKNEGALFIVPAAYAGEVMRIGMDTAGVNISTAEINLPDISRPPTSWGPSSVVVGSVGVRLANINASEIKFGRINYFETGIWAGGIGEGTVYCEIYLGQLSYNKRQLYIVPGSGGWFNANILYGGNFSLQESQSGGTAGAGFYQIYADGSSPATSIVGNIFIAPSLEGSGPQYSVYGKLFYKNTFVNAYHETNIARKDVTVSGDTLTTVSHGLAVGDMLYFYATSLPTGMFDVTPYYVVSVPTSDTFKVSLNKAGTAITFSSAGTAVKYILQQRCLFDGTDAYSNQFINLTTPPSFSLNIVQSGGANNNTLSLQSERTIRVYQPNDLPLYKGGNSASTATSRPIFAAYPTTVDPATDPTYWATSISDRGLLFGASGAETGRFFGSAGVLLYRRPADTANFEVPSCTRTPTLIAITALSCAASGRTLTTFTLTNAATNDHVLLTPVDALPDGIAIAWARVSAANTIQIAFYNWTAGIISLTANFQCIAFRRFY